VELLNTKNKMYVIINNEVIMEPKRAYIHQLNRRCVAVNNTSVFF